MAKILVVEDEGAIRELLLRNLRLVGHQPQGADSLPAARALLERERFDLMLLDIMLGKDSGFDLLEQERETPVICLTAKGSLGDKLRGLHLGADDYIVKPFEMVELAARVETVLRRYNKGAQRIAILDVCIDTLSRTVTQNGRPVSLTNKEYALLLLFARNPNIALFRETIFEQVWESNYMGDTRTVDLHVQRLRKKLGWDERITAVYKVGYRLEV